MNLSHAVWKKSTYSAASDCIEIAFLDGQVAIRDSKDSGGPVLLFTKREWNAFVAGVHDGQFHKD